MRRVAALGKMVIMFLFISGMVSPSFAGIKAEFGEHTDLEVGIWVQTWYQWVEEFKDRDTADPEDLNDFLIRRAYLYLKGNVTDRVNFFTHIASDRVGQDELAEKTSLGLGGGVAWRDLWITLNLHEAFMVQMGRMYIPLTRNYGTTSTKAMLTTDLPFLQGGIRGGIFYTSKVGRDDGVTIWGNLADGLVQYRFMGSEGVEDDDVNPEDNLRFVGRVSLSLLEPETGWFNKGTYLGKKKVLSIGLGADSQDDLMLGGTEDDNQVLTADVFFDHPLGDGAVTVEAAYIDIEHCTTTQSLVGLSQGGDTDNWYVSAGYLFPFHLQPYVRYETMDVDDYDETDILSVGANYYLKGHNCKISADYTNVDPDDSSLDNHDIFTLQITIGF